ncbi:MEKHLA domain-containing protein [Symbioplanes lichenis]|uniref:MEKHLA domain-containing protein n=1 Tax=Symbioplanes lichenis TaxID=1629072 RepID=UPI002738321D|nr:MEKHLA domain-containing protein [Actinoplanes lichenis]
MTRDAAFADLLDRSYAALLGRPLVPAGQDKTPWLYDAPSALLAHDTSADPLFTYANRAAQRLFGYDWDEFVGLPSRLSAGDEDRGSRQEFLDTVARQGYAEHYRGRRVAKDGRVFWIEDVTLWNLTRDDGSPAGQAALIRRWS